MADITVPSAEEFAESKFILAPDLAKLADELIDEHEFTHIRQCSVDYLWREKGGTRGGKIVLGKAQRPSGLLRLYSKADFVIILAADHMRSQKFTPKQIEAVLFHELLHISTDDDDEPTLVGHDVEAFVEEVINYGLYKSDLGMLKTIKPQLEQ